LNKKKLQAVGTDIKKKILQSVDTEYKEEKIAGSWY
jgi:hypothetical protein